MQPLPLKCLWLAVTETRLVICLKSDLRERPSECRERGEVLFYCWDVHTSLALEGSGVSIYVLILWTFKFNSNIHFNGILNSLWAWYNKESLLISFSPSISIPSRLMLLSFLSLCVPYMYSRIYSTYSICIWTARLHSKSEKMNRSSVICWLLEGAPNPIRKGSKYFTSVLWLVVCKVPWVFRELEKYMRYWRTVSHK